MVIKDVGSGLKEDRKEPKKLKELVRGKQMMLWTLSLTKTN